MAKIIAPNRQYNGVSATVNFVNGVGECTNPYLIKWFKSRGYEVIEEPVSEPEPKVTENNAEIEISVKAEIDSVAEEIAEKLTEEFAEKLTEVKSSKKKKSKV